jgi:hypothetical protein
MKASITPVGRGKKKLSLASLPAFGMWKDRTDMKNVSAYIRALRGGFVGRDSSPAAGVHAGLFD